MSFFGNIHPSSPFQPTHHHTKSVHHHHHYSKPQEQHNYSTFTGTMYDELPVTHTDSFKIVMILDESGSMSIIKDKMINSINTLITEQKQVVGKETTFTKVKFNNNYHTVIDNKRINCVNNLTNEDYIPTGSTALFDAIGKTISRFRNERDVLMVIVTDGEENASSRFNKSMINNMIEDKQKNNNWTYVYLSNDLSTAKQGDSIGCTPSRFASNCVVEQESFGDFMSQELNCAIKNYRSAGVSVQSQLNK